MNFTSPETRVIVLSDTETAWSYLHFVWTKHQNVADGRTNRETDRSVV